MNGETNHLIAVDRIDAEEFVSYFVKTQPKAKKYRDVITIAVKKFKGDYQTAHLRRNELVEKLTSYINKMIEEEIESCLLQLINEGTVKVEQREGEDRLV